MSHESLQQRSKRILAKLKRDYPGKAAYDTDGRGQHFVCEVEPTQDHPEYDKAIVVIFKTKAHKHNKIVQRYTILSGNLTVHLDDKTITLKPGDTYTIQPGIVHWAESDECWLEEYSTPGWTKDDHILVGEKDPA